MCFKKDDKVKCVYNGPIDGIYATSELTVGKVYTVIECSDIYNVRVTEDNGKVRGFFPKRFIPYVETKEETLVDTQEVPGGSTPSQYALPSYAKELQDLIEYRGMNFALGNIFKAVFRMGHKNGADELYDLNKIIFFANREIERINRENKTEE